ncbi:MAG: hypothetical protein RL885_06235 [Planctomycetota bacterium]
MRMRASLILIALGLAGMLWSSSNRPRRPPEVAEPPATWINKIGHLLGPGRLLVRDVLWFRLLEDIELGRTWRAKGQMELLVQLSPHEIEAWKYLGQHLAYDVAATTVDPAERQSWVDEGTHRIEEGLRHHPDSKVLHYTLARLLTPWQVIESSEAEPGPEEDRALEHLAMATREPDPLFDALYLEGTLLRRRASRAILARDFESAQRHWAASEMVHRRIERLIVELSTEPDPLVLEPLWSEYCHAWLRLLEGDESARALIETFPRDHERDLLLDQLD